jgi:hypothetical protein
MLRQHPDEQQRIGKLSVVDRFQALSVLIQVTKDASYSGYEHHPTLWTSVNLKVLAKGTAQWTLFTTCRSSSSVLEEIYNEIGEFVMAAILVNVRCIICVVSVREMLRQ